MGGGLLVLPLLAEIELLLVVEDNVFAVGLADLLDNAILLALVQVGKDLPGLL